MNGFRALRNPNYRLWAAGAFVSNIGTWMQRTAQDWVVLTELTHHNATAVGIVMSLQFGPQILFLPLTGWAADRCDRRRLVLTTQATMALLALALGLLALSHRLVLWHVYVFAFLLGTVTAFDAPARQTFVGELVGEDDLANAVGLNSTSFNAARLVGPAVAGVLIAGIGSGWVFLVNALSFVGVIIALWRLQVTDLHRRDMALRAKGSMLEGLRYVMGRADLKAALLMLFFVATFGMNFPIFISTMSVTVFHGAAAQYGVLSSSMAVGSVTGAFMAARRSKPSILLLTCAALAFGLACLVAALMPDYRLFGLVLVLIGACVQTFSTSTNSLVQLSTEPGMRGRVVAILLAIALGGTPLGAPVVGWVADRFGPRWSLMVAAASGLAAGLVALYYFRRHRQLEVHRDGMRLSFRMAPER